MLVMRRLGYQCPPNYNPGDFFINTLAIVPGAEEECRNRVARICYAFKVSEDGRAMEKEVELCSDEASKASPSDMEDTNRNEMAFKYKASWFAQFRAVVARSWTANLREPFVIKLRLFGTVVFCEELPIFLREHQSRMYRTDVYFIGKTVAEIPFFILSPILFTAIAYYMIGLNESFERFLVCNVIMVIVANVSCSFGYMISCMASTIAMALAIGPPFVIPVMMFGGFFLNNDSVPVYFLWLKYISWFYYGNEALMINQWEDVRKIDCGRTVGCPPNGDAVLDSLNFDKARIPQPLFLLLADFLTNLGVLVQNNKTRDLMLLLVLMAAFRFIAFLALYVRAYRRK
ncbi:unnamed protein product [Darwinula stevensoni]|uniref:ABC-2 type transporter transmembrane domain-containing protein n=1 Tax=Darwinula stevensoni TaxID=69355 RepID=A0A7R8XER9_9CRUS|nr:unnamed protein product [Darwinula stevensoni]CAG0889837.1 unnamed protein product [Darwinula stevensoni]